MNGKHRVSFMTALGMAAALAAAPALRAQETPTADPQQHATQTQQAQQAAQPDAIVGGTVTQAFRPLRASKLIGTTVRNKEGDKIGQVDDIVVDSHGQVRYVALSHGGFLGFGDKLFAVPWSAITMRAERDDPQEFHLFVSVDKEVLENAPGFDKDQWPDATTGSFWIAVDKHYGTERRAYRGETGSQSSEQDHTEYETRPEQQDR